MKEIDTSLIRDYSTGDEKQLYIRGNEDLLSTTKLTIVGTRKPSTYGARAVRHIMRNLRGLPITIVSGLAIGIDTIAHETALEFGLKTIAVPGSGISDSSLYPKTNRKLAQRILDQRGALLSPWEEQTASPWTFPVRNAVMASMADLVVVIEASEISGTMITAREAMKRNIPLGAVPGDVFADGSAGPNWLIQQGAHIITCSEDITKILFSEQTPPFLFNGITNPHEGHPLLAHLNNPVSRDAFIDSCGMSTSDAIVKLGELELLGLIEISHDGVIHRV